MATRARSPLLQVIVPGNSKISSMFSTFCKQLSWSYKYNNTDLLLWAYCFPRFLRHLHVCPHALVLNPSMASFCPLGHEQNALQGPQSLNGSALPASLLSLSWLQTIKSSSIRGISSMGEWIVQSMASKGVCFLLRI